MQEFIFLKEDIEYYFKVAHLYINDISSRLYGRIFFSLGTSLKVLYKLQIYKRKIILKKYGLSAKKVTNI